mmetsp:Transcript_10205/g.20409  ORF Transcript_10205/g.20409 Transcript_10205/m.20409 type:complete len:322 (-) Transcript_10205:202-1167(-)
MSSFPPQPLVGVSHVGGDGDLGGAPAHLHLRVFRRGELVMLQPPLVVGLDGEESPAAADDGPHQVHHALEDHHEPAAAARALVLLLALPAPLGVLKRLVDVPVVVVVVPPPVVVPGGEVGSADGAAVVAVGAEVAQARRARVVAEPVVGPLTPVVAVHLLVGRGGAPAVGAVRARVAHGGQKVVVAVVVVPVPVLTVVVVAVEPSVVVVPPVAPFPAAVVAHPVQRPLAAVVAVVVVHVRLDLGHNHALVLQNHFPRPRVDLGHHHVLELALLHHVRPRTALVEQQHHLRHLQALDFVRGALRRVQSQLRAFQRKPRAADD